MRKYLALVIVAVVVAVTWSLDRGTAEQKEPAGDVSALYKLFDPQKLTAKHVDLSGKGAFDTGGSQSGLMITPPGRLVKKAHFSGKPTEEQLKAILASLQSDMVKLADTSEVRIVEKPKDTILDRPLSYLRVHLIGGWVDVGSLRGSYFTYSQGKVEGAVDIIAAHTDPEDRKRWTISCSLHEVAR
jgi:hypothetical protein